NPDSNSNSMDDSSSTAYTKEAAFVEQQPARAVNHEGGEGYPLATERVRRDSSDPMEEEDRLAYLRAQAAQDAALANYSSGSDSEMTSRNRNHADRNSKTNGRTNHRGGKGKRSPNPRNPRGGRGRHHSRNTGPRRGPSTGSG